MSKAPMKCPVCGKVFNWGQISVEACLADHGIIRYGYVVRGGPVAGGPPTDDPCPWRCICGEGLADWPAVEEHLFKDRTHLAECVLMASARR